MAEIDSDGVLRSSSRNFALAIGNWVAPTPEISTLNWAPTGNAGIRSARPAALQNCLRISMWCRESEIDEWFTRTT